MHVQSAPTNDLAAMLEAPRKSAESREATFEDFESSLAQALLGSITAETENDDVDRSLAEGEPVEDDVAEVEPEAKGAEVLQTQSAMLRSTPIAVSVQASSVPIEGEASESTENSPPRRGPRENADSASPAPRERIDSALSAAVVERATPKHVQPSTSDSTRPLVNESAVTPATAPTLVQTSEIKPVASDSDSAKRSALVSIASEPIRAEAKRQTAPRDLDRTPRERELRAVSTEIEQNAANDKLYGRNTAPSGAPPARQDPPRLAHLVDEIPVASAAPTSGPMPTSPASSIQAPPGVGLLVGGVANPPLNAEPALQATAPQRVEALPQNVQFLASRGGGTVRLQLHPAELGEIEITVSIRGDVVDVAIHANEPTARAAVMAHREQLTDSLGSRDLRMEGFDVTSGGREQGTGGRQTQWDGTENRRGPHTPGFETNAGGNGHPTVIENRAAAAATAYHKQGIDLRI